MASPDTKSTLSDTSNTSLPEKPKTPNESFNSQAERKALSARVSIDPPSEISSLFEGTHSDLMKQAPKIANDLMNDTIKNWGWPPLSPEQKENIKLATIDRIASGAFVQMILWWIQTKLSGMVEKVQKIDIKNLNNLNQLEELAKEFSPHSSETKDAKEPQTLEERITTKMMTMMAEWLGEIQKAHESSPQPSGYTELLKHPKALVHYKYGDDIVALLARSGDAVSTKESLKTDVKSKIQNLESQIMGMQATKEKLLDTFSHMPEFASDHIFQLMAWIFRIPIFGKFAAAFLGFDDPKTAINELKMETKQRKSIHLLISFGVTRNEHWVIAAGENNGKLGILKDIDFTGVDFAKLKPFMKKMKSEWVDVSNPEFWKAVFVNGKIEVGEKDNKKTISFPKWDEGKETAETIINKLNSQRAQSQVSSISQISIEKPPWPTVWPMIPVVAWVAAENSREKTPITQASALSQAFVEASRIPFNYTFDGITQRVETLWDTLAIGDMRWTIKWKWSWPMILATSQIGMDSTNVMLTFPIIWTKVGSKSSFINSIPQMLANKVGETNEIQIPNSDSPNNPDTLIITRIA
jgi:hypothetical protein